MFWATESPLVATVVVANGDRNKKLHKPPISSWWRQRFSRLMHQRRRWRRGCKWANISFENEEGNVRYTFVKPQTHCIRITEYKPATFYLFTRKLCMAPFDFAETTSIRSGVVPTYPEGCRGGRDHFQLTQGERRGTPWTGCQTIAGLTQTEEQPFTLAITPTGNSESSINPTCMSPQRQTPADWLSLVPVRQVATCALKIQWWSLYSYWIW